MKKILSSLAVLALITCLLSGCGNNNSNLTKIGVMQFGEFDALQSAYNGFVEGLEDAGYKDNENIKLTYLSAAADTANCPTIADTLINNNSDLILSIATPSALAVKEKTSSIPVLFTAVTDPVQSGIVVDTNKPGANISGTSDLNPVKEQILLLKQLLPNAKNVAVLYCSSESNSAFQYELAKAQLEEMGLNCINKTISTIDEAKSTVESLKDVADAIYIPTDNTLADGMTTVVMAANSINLPIIGGEPGMVKNGALATFGIDYFELGKQTAKMAVKILESENKLETVGNMPIEYQTKDCVTAINTDTAKALGITISDDILNSATIYTND